MWALPLAVNFVLLPNQVDVGFVGSGSAVGAIVAQGALIAIGFGAVAAIVWLIGCGVEFLT